MVAIPPSMKSDTAVVFETADLDQIFPQYLKQLIWTRFSTPDEKNDDLDQIFRPG